MIDLIDSFRDIFGHADHVSREARRGTAVPLLPGVIVRSGTSRVVVVRRGDLPAVDSEDRFKVLAALFGGSGLADGLGAVHYQLNKAVVVGDPRGPHGFGYRFYQFDRDSGRVLANMACANSSVAAGMTALLSGVAKPDPAGLIHALNIGTGQAVELRPPATAAEGDWAVSFLQPPANELRPLSGDRRDSVPGPGGAAVYFQVVSRGNVFVLVDIDPADMTLELAAKLAEEGERQATEAGIDFTQAHAPKIIPYRVRERTEAGATVATACYFNGQRHQSLPGSGSMCLGSYLALGRLARTKPDGDAGVLRYGLDHPSGRIDVVVDWVRTPVGYHARAAGFETPARLLSIGCLTIPGRLLPAE